MANYTYDNICSIQSQLLRLKALKEDSYEITHGISRGHEQNGSRTWEEFVPTKFIYSMFAFNMLYNINWHQSLLNGRIIRFKKSDSESYKMHLFLHFFFSNIRFFNMEQKMWFRSVILDGESAEIIMTKLEDIQLDRYTLGEVMFDDNDADVNANVTDEDAIRLFKDSVYDVIGYDDYSVTKGIKHSEGNINRIYGFIYMIRCNIFHGIKAIDEMMTEGQKEKLVIYTRFLYAANSLVFRYLDYLQSLVEDIREGEE